MSLENRPYDENDEWVTQFASICRKRLDDAPLTKAERDLEAAVELLSVRFPGVVEDLLLSRPPEAVSAPLPEEVAKPARLAAWTGKAVSRLAASTPDPPRDCYSLVIEAIQEGRNSIDRDLGAGPVCLLRIMAGEGLVQACRQKGFVFTVERQDGSSTVVDEFGENVGFENLKHMGLLVDPRGKTIRLKML